MTRIVDWAVNNTRLVLALIVVTVVAGVIAFMSIPKEADPDIPFPMMAVQVTYPGVYVQEVQSGVRTIVGVSTSICSRDSFLLGGMRSLGLSSLIFWMSRLFSG